MSGDGDTVASAVERGDHAALTAALEAGAPVDARDHDDWSALDRAAGRGDVVAIGLLLRHGADPLATGRELRTPYRIALAAGRIDAARLLRDAEAAAGAGSPERHQWRPYCRAYLLGELRAFPGWIEPEAAGGPDTVVFVHDDLTVTRSMWRDQDVLRSGADSAWERFCHDELGFRVPDDFDLVPDG